MSEMNEDTQSMKIVYTPLLHVAAWPRNPKRHDAKSMDASIERFGFNDPPTVDERTGKLVEGHGRIEALERRQQAGKAPPARVRTDPDGGWLVPIVRGVSFADETEAEAYLLAHNRIGADMWDNTELAESLRAVKERGFDSLGWSADEAAKIFAKVDGKVADFPEFDESAAAGVIVHTCPKCQHRFS